MQELSRYAVGLDIGTHVVKCVVAHQDDAASAPTIIGLGEAFNGGLRKGVVVNLVTVAQAIDKALEEAERVSGHQVTSATISINGSHIIGMSSRGVVAVGSSGHEINEDDLARAEDAATLVQLPANREILEVTPRNFRLDDQDNIKDPIGMTGVRLEVDAHVITALSPNLRNLLKVTEMTHTKVNHTVPAALASSHAVLNDQQKENGVLLIDIGHATTNFAVYEEGDLQHISVITMGGLNITNDLAVGLKVDLEVAEKVKLAHSLAMPSLRKSSDKKATVKHEDHTYEFELEQVDFIVEARLEEIFELVNAELQTIGRVAKLPGGVVITGGTAQIKGIADYAKEALQLSTRIGQAGGFGGVAENINQPQYACALGLMLIDFEGTDATRSNSAPSGTGFSLQSVTKQIKNMVGKLRS